MKFSDVHKTIGNYMLADGMSPVIDLDKSHGSWLVDGNTGDEYLDMFSMFASLSVGYNHPYVLENKDRLLASAINKPTNSDIYSPEMANFVHTFGEIAQPNYLPYSFFIEGGALAVENALKAAFDWKVKLNLSKGKPKGGNQIIHFKDCFHGRSGYTMSLTDSPDPRKVQYFPKFNWPRVLNPSIKFPLDEKSIDEVIRLEEKSLSQIKQVLLDNPDDVACMILEPIQGEGGIIIPPDNWLAEIRDICTKHGVLMILDEVQSGLGRTGKLFAFEHANIRPDGLILGKALGGGFMPVSVFLSSKDVLQWMNPGSHGSTFGGNPLGSAIAKRSLELLYEEGLIENSRIMGEYFKNSLLQLNSKIIKEVRGKGLWLGVEIDPEYIEGKALSKLLLSKGILCKETRETTIRFAPPLIITKEEIDWAVEIIGDTLKTIERKEK